MAARDEGWVYLTPLGWQSEGIKCVVGSAFHLLQPKEASLSRSPATLVSRAPTTMEEVSRKVVEGISVRQAHIGTLLG